MVYEPTRRAALFNLGAMACSLTGSGAKRLRARDASVVVTDFGANSDGTDAAPGFAKAIAELARRGGGRLVVSPGTYSFATAIDVCLAFNNLSNITIDAAEAEFVFRERARPLNFKNCRNVRLNGLTIRWERPPFSQGDVSEVSIDHLSAVINLDEITPADGWTCVEAIGEYDRASGLIAKHGIDVYGAVTKVEPIDRRHVRLRFNRPVPLAPAQTLVLRHAIYEAHAIEMRDCEDMLFQNVAIRSAPGMGFVAALTRNITVRRCEIAPQSSSGLFMSTTADAVHFGNCSGEILIENNRFAKMGDDGVNVTTSYWRIVERPDKKGMIISQWRDQTFRLDDRPAPADAFEVASAETLELLGEGQIDETHLVGPAPAATMELHFTEDVRGALGDLTYDNARSPHLTVRDNRFEDNRARGVLAHKNVVIQNNLFKNQSAQGILLAPDTWWMEGPEVEHVRIAGNTFDGVDRWELKQGSVTIKTCNGGLVSMQNADNSALQIEIKDNIYRNTGMPYVVEYAGQCKP